MAAFFSLILLLPLIPHVQSAATLGTCKSIADVELTCRAAAEPPHSVDYDFCVRSLGSHRSSDLHGLAVAAARLAIAHAESTESKMADLVDLEAEAGATALGECLDRYAEAADALRDALDNMGARVYPRAVGLMGASLGAHEHCRRALKGTGLSSHLAAEDRDYGALAGIAMAIAASVE